jgi:DNA-binding MarR family transcriptional regulator
VADRQLLLKAATTSELVARVVEASIAPLGLPGFLLALLTHVRDLGPVSPTAVSLASGVPATTLRDNIQRLVDRGLVRRAPNDDDRRSYLLVTTKRGRRLAAAASDALHEAYDELERQLPRPIATVEREADELNAALRAVLARLAESR